MVRPMHVVTSIMNMRETILPILLAAVLSGCSHAPQTAADTAMAADVQRTVKEVSISEGEAMHIADISIEGMSCEMMCGGSIRKALAKLPGVTLAEIKFIEGEELDHAIVTYDGSLIDDARMIEAIHGLHGGQYKVLAVDITQQVKREHDGNGTSEERGEEKGVRVYAPSGASLLPSVLALLTQILRL